MASEKVRIAYEGEALENGSMDIAYLAPALMAFGRMVQRANDVMGNTYPVRLMIKADNIRAGSFDVTLEIVTTTLQEIKLFMGIADDVGLKALVEALGLGCGTYKGLIWLIKHIGLRKVVKVDESTPHGTVVNLTLNDNSNVIIDKKVYNFYVDREVRAHIDEVMKPLEMEGVDSFQVRNPLRPESKEHFEKINSEERAMFMAPELNPTVETSNVTESEERLNIIGVVFDKNQKWRFSDGDVQFWARIEDEDFWKAVISGKYAFRDGDGLNVICKKVQVVTTNGDVKTERTITKVLKVIPKPTQIQLPLE